MSLNPTSVVVPESSEYVLPTRPRPAGEVVVVADHRDVGASLRRGSEVARQLGERFLAMAESHELLAAELRARLESLDGAITEASRAQLKGAVRDVLAVLEWSDAVNADLVREGRLAAEGKEAIDVTDLCTAVASEHQTPEQPIHIGGQCLPWWGSAPLLAEALGLAIDLVGERSQGVGARSVEVANEVGQVLITIRASGEPADRVDPATIERFRRAAAELGASVSPDATGLGGTGIVLQLPV
jgi:hypothetical protein